MRVKVELQAHLKQYSPSGQATFEHDLREGANVSHLIRSLGMPEELTTVILVNGANTGPEYPLHQGDHVTLIPPLAGG